MGLETGFKLGQKVITACTKTGANNSMLAMKPNIAYHGSPFDFNCFDSSKIGLGEGFGKKGKGIYLYRTPKFAPYFANIRSKDAPIHLGCSKKMDNATPMVYTVSGLKDMNLLQVSEQEAKNIARSQEVFEQQYPNIDGIELPSTEICIFPKSVSKLHIDKKQDVMSFVRDNKTCPFRTWTTDENKISMIYDN